MSPSLWWDNGSLLKVAPAFVADTEKALRSVHIAVGKEGKGMVGPTKELAALIRKQPDVRVGFKYFPEFGHADPLHGAVMESFRWMGQDPK